MKIILLGFVLGVLSLTVVINFPAWLWLGSGFLAVCLALTLSSVASVGSWLQHPARRSAVQVLIFLAAMLFGHGYAEQQLQQALHARLTQAATQTAIVKVKGISDGLGDNWRQIVAVQNTSTAKEKPAAQQWLLYSAYSWDEGKKLSAPAMQPNQFWQVTVKLKPAHSNASWGAFDSEKWLLEQHVLATGTVQHARLLNAQEVIAFGLPQASWFEHFDTAIQQQRLKIRDHFQRFNVPASGVMLGLLTGDRSLIDAKTTLLYQQMGISHLLAISGPHVVLAALMMTFICRWLLNFFPSLFLRVERSRWLLPIFFSVVLLYACLAGFELPAQRTVLMVGITAGLFWLRKRWSPLFILLLAASLILLFDPLAVLSAAFWLSFGAVAILLFMSQNQTETTENLSWYKRLTQTMRQFVHMQWRLFILLMPLVLVVFNKVSLLSPLVNLMAIPLLTLLIVPLNLLAWAISKISISMANLIWQLLLWLIDVFHLVLTILAQLVPHALTPFYLNLPAIIALSVALIILLLPKGILPRWWLLFLLIPVFWPYRTTAPLMLHVLDVGQGLSIVIQTKRHTMLLDTGSKLPTQREGMGEKVVLPALHALGVHRVDKLMLTHLDNDHSGGAPAVMDNLPVIQLTSSAVFEPYATHLCEAGQHWVWDTVQFKVLAPWPTEKLKLSANDASCVLMIEVPASQNAPSQRVLIMGDAGFYPEFDLLKKQVDLKADILVLGHHGSRNSSASAFLQAVAPSRAVVSAGFLNRYHHPAPVVLKRLQEQNIAIDSTISGGTLSYYLGASNQLTPIRYRDQKPWLQRDDDNVTEQ